MEKYIHQENLALFTKRLAESHSDAEREVLLRLLADEEKWVISSSVDLHQGDVEEETRVAALGTGFQPDEFKLMRSVLDRRCSFCLRPNEHLP
jgi:hypothetical protein